MRATAFIARGGVSLALGLVVLTGFVLPVAATDHPGTNGKFTSTVVQTPGEPDQITITYQPYSSKVGKCDSIYICQTVRRVDQDGNVIEPKNLDDGKFKHAQDDKTDGGTTVDHLSSEKDPYYNGNDEDKDDTSQGSTSTTDSTSTTMTDGPCYLDTTFPPGVTSATLTFEDCAVCASTGTVLDCVTWTYTRVQGDGTLGMITGPSGNAAPPSDEFGKAKKKFEVNHRNGALCPESVAEDFAPQKNLDVGYIEVLPVNPLPGQDISIKVDAVNTCGQPVEGIQWQATDMGGSRFLGAGTISMIGPYDYALVFVNVPAVPGNADNVVFTLDFPNLIPEYDETDNQEVIPIHYGTTGVEPATPANQVRLAVAPVPFRSATRVTFDLPRGEATRLEIFDVSGTRVRLLHSGSLAAGTHSFEWNGQDNLGREVPAGTYFVRLTVAKRILTAKAVLVR